MNFAMRSRSIPLGARVGELGVGVPDEEVDRHNDDDRYCVTPCSFNITLVCNFFQCCQQKEFDERGLASKHYTPKGKRLGRGAPSLRSIKNQKME